MTQPTNILIGDPANAISPPKLLEPDFDRYHSGVPRLRQSSPTARVVMWIGGARYFGGAPAGTHYGIRDGEQSAFADFSGLRRCYCTAEDWQAAGLLLPGAA
jgi:hypothetical protein